MSTTTNRAAADARSQAVALTAYGGSLVGKVSYQAAGVVAAEVSDLSDGYGSLALVRCSATGRFERITSFATGDDVVGYAEPDGRVHLLLGMPWELILALIAAAASGAEFVPGGTDTQVYYNDDGDLATTDQITVAAGRATHVSPIVNGTPVYRSGGTDITSPVGRFTTASTTPVVITRTPAAQDTEIVSIIVRSRRNTSNTKRGSWRFVATVSRNGGNAVLDDLATATPFNLNAGTVVVSVSGTGLIVTVTPADTDSRDWDYELRVQGDT